MIDIHSPIIDFYPASFELDMNGKKAAWEAIVKIPFIDEARLLKAVRSRDNRLSSEEKLRNGRGDPWRFHYVAHNAPVQYPSPLPNVFPDIFLCFSRMAPLKMVHKDRNVAINHLCPGALIKENLLPGFPSIYTLKFSSTLGYHGVNVFNSDSTSQSRVININNQYENQTPESVAMLLCGSTVFSAWPFLVESRVKSVADECFVYEKYREGKHQRILKTPHTQETMARFSLSVEKSDKYYSKRFGVIVGQIDMCANVECLIGMQLLNDGSLVKEFKAQFEFDPPVQLLVSGDEHLDHRFTVIDKSESRKNRALLLMRNFLLALEHFFLRKNYMGRCARYYQTML